MPPRHVLKLLALLLPLPAGVDARPIGYGEPQASSTPAQSSGEWRYECQIKRVLKGGTILLSRTFTENGEAMGDFVLWQPVGHDPQRTIRPLELELSYLGSLESRPEVELRKVEVRLHVGIDGDLPEVALLQIQRPFPIEPYGVVGSTALSTEVFPNSERDMRNGHGELPLGDLLAYAEGYDTLEWRLIRPSDRLGGSQELVRGKLDIAALHEAVVALPTLRSALAAKTEKPKAQCARTWWGEQVVP